MKEIIDSVAIKIKLLGRAPANAALRAAGWLPAIINQNEERIKNA